MGTGELVPALVEALENEWLVNHAERCSEDPDHLVGSRCFCPSPAILDRAKGVSQ